MKDTGKLNRFYFNTGVRPYTITNFPFEYHKRVGNVIRKTLLIPFECNAPENTAFMFACNNPEMPEAKQPNVIVREIFNSNLCSRYAYFRISN
jgi:hypothetical protein